MPSLGLLTMATVMTAVTVVVTVVVMFPCGLRAAPLEESCPGGLDHGFGSHYNWSHTLGDALEEAEEFGKPILMLIHKHWCPMCKVLRPRFAHSREILRLSHHMVFVNLFDEPLDDTFAPDGRYVPRILFLDYMGIVHPEIYNIHGTAKYKYYYLFPDEEIAPNMKRAIRDLSRHASPDL
ncbi:thioredoxin domain-containing protein 12-like [Lampetra fluviatilis]